MTIDGVSCAVTEASSTTLKCTTGARPNRVLHPFSLKVGDNAAVVTAKPFFYAERWSSSATWGGEAAPREDDAVYVPPEMVLMVDVSTPLLKVVVVEGGIVFSDERDLEFKARMMVIYKGVFQAGSEAKPYQHKLVLTFTGDYYDKQLPVFGDKGLACYNCQFDMHGKPRNFVYSLLASTAIQGATSLTVEDAVDWQPGERIVVASSSWDHREAEERTIASVSADQKTLSFAEPLLHKHYSAV